MTDKTNIKVLWRFDERLYASWPDDDGWSRGTPTIKVEPSSFHVIKHTPRGCWISVGYRGKKRFICWDWKKKFAHATKEDALQSFIARKHRQAAIYEARLDTTRRALAIAKCMVAEPGPVNPLMELLL